MKLEHEVKFDTLTRKICEFALKERKMHYSEKWVILVITIDNLDDSGMLNMKIID